MAGETMSGFLMKKDSGWCVVKGDKTYRIVDEDSMMCLDSDTGKVVDFELVLGQEWPQIAKICGSRNDEMSWDEIEQWYASDNFPPFGGPFSDAMSHFEWLKINFEPPKLKRQE